MREHETGKIYVNFDPKIAELMRETDCMIKMNDIDVPQEGKELFLRKESLQRSESKLKVCDYSLLIAQ